MKIIQFTFCLLLFTNLKLLADPMSGDYIIGSSTYPTFNAAVDSLIKNGIDGPVVFEVISGIYDEQVRLPNISGSNETNTITFEAQMPGKDNVIWTFASTKSDSDYILKLDSCQYIHLKELTFKPTGTDFLNSIEIKGNSTNLNLENNYFTTPIGNKGWQIVVLSPSSGPPFEVISEITVTGNHFYGGNGGIDFRGSSEEPDSNIYIKNNSFEEHSSCALVIWNLVNLTCTENRFSSNQPSGSIIVNKLEGPKNYINNNLMTNLSGLNFFGFADTFFKETDKVFVFNNVIKSVMHGITLLDYKYVEIFNNTVISDNPSEDLNVSTIYIRESDSLKVFDNIIKNSGIGEAIVIDSITSDLSFDSNIYDVKGDTLARYLENKFTNLTDWQNVTISGTRDPNSALGKIELLDTINYDLVHCSTDPSLQFSSAGLFDPAELANDYNGVARNPANFWPGATELTIDEGKIVKVSGFVAQGTDTLKEGTLVAYVDSSDRQLLDQVGETTIKADGSFSFDAVPALPLWIRIYPEDTNYLTSYHDSVIRKSQSTPLNPVDCDGLQTDIFPRKIYPFEFDGLGTIEGYVTYADLSSSKVAAKDPIPGLDVVLDRIPPSKSIKATVINGDNFYSFGGLPDGTYSVTIEYEGLDADTIYVIDVVSTDLRNTDKNYCIDTTRAITDCLPPESVNELDAGLKLYPNPFNHQLSIQAERNIDRIRIIDLRGLVVLDEKLNGNNIIINTNHLVPALYFVEFTAGDSRIIKRVIKQ